MPSECILACRSVVVDFNIGIGIDIGGCSGMPPAAQNVFFSSRRNAPNGSNQQCKYEDPIEASGGGKSPCRRRRRLRQHSYVLCIYTCSLCAGKERSAVVLETIHVSSFSQHTFVFFFFSVFVPIAR